MLAVFLLYISIAGGGTPSLQPSQLKGRTGEVALVGKVLGTGHGRRARGAGLRFRLRDVKGDGDRPVVYRGSVPDLFKVGRDIGSRAAPERRLRREAGHAA